MELSHARLLAEDLVQHLVPLCERVQIAGSIRRQKPFPKDIEIVCIPKMEPQRDMFGNLVEWCRIPEFITFVNSLEKIKGDPRGKYTQRRFKNEVVDLFMANKTNWVNTLVIRTGSAEFTHLLMKRALRLGFEHRDGLMYNGDSKVLLPTEEAFFELLNLPYIEPKDRNEEVFKKLK